MLRRVPCRRLFASLLLGTATTVLLAWAFAMREAHLWYVQGGLSTIELFPRHQIRTSDGDIGLEGSECAGASSVYTCPRWTIVDQYAFDPYYPTPDHVPAEERAIFGAPPWRVPSWAIMPRAADDTLVWNATHAFGWPARSLLSLQEQHRKPQSVPMYPVTRYGRTFSIPFTQNWEGVLPLRPIPTGFAADTSLYGASWWLLFLSIAALRRGFRRRRSLCPYCAYSRAGLAPSAPCPECGRT